MKSIEIGVARIVVAAIGLMVAALAYADGQSSGATQAAVAEQSGTAERSSRVSEVEAQMARADLAGRLEDALGSDFGGVWFEPSTAQVQVGVTSPESRRNAEAVAAQAGLPGNVTEVAVGSTWPELDAAQERWDRRLSGLFARAEVATWLDPERNSVEVELGSLVPSSRRAVLEREAAAEKVDVSIVVTPYPHLRARPQDRCNKFEPGLAFCDPTMVGGVTIDGELVNQKRKSCTGGPTVIPELPGKAEDATKTYVLTAGHCIKDWGGTGKKWFAYNKQGAPKGEKEIGLAGPYVFGDSDVGVIEIDRSKNYWAKDKDFIPVVPTLAAWNLVAESEPFPVVKKNTPAKDAKTCLAGQMVGIQCGKITKTDQTLTVGDVTIKNLIEVDIGNAEEGDSGGPWFAEAPFKNKNPTGYAEGVHVGERNGKAVFQSLDTAFAELSSVKGLNLELLTTANEKRRHPAVKAEKYPVTIHGTSTVTQKFATEAGSIECKWSTYHAVVSEETSTVTVSPEYKECVASFWGLGATVSMEGCAYVFHGTEEVSADNYRASADVSCPEGKSIKLVAGTCKAEIKAQTGRETVDLVNDTSASPKKDITMRPTLTGIAYTVTQDGLFCPFNGTGEKSGGEYTSSEGVTITGQNPSEPAEKIAIEVFYK